MPPCAGPAALEMGLEVCEAFKDQDKFEEFAYFADMLLHPTVFEVGQQ